MTGITRIAVGADTLEATVVIQALRITSTWRTCTLIIVGTAVRRARITVVTFWAVAAITALEVRTDGTWTAGIRMCALVDVRTAVIWIAMVAFGTCAGVIAGRIDALRTSTAGSGTLALVEV